MIRDPKRALSALVNRILKKEFDEVVENKDDKGKVTSRVGYNYAPNGQVLVATDLREQESPRPFRFEYDEMGRMTREVWTYSDGTLGQVEFMEYNQDGSVVRTTYYPKDGQLHLYPSGVEISVAPLEKHAKVFQVPRGDYAARLNYDVARRFNLPDLFGRDVMQMETFEFFDAYPWLDTNSPTPDGQTLLNFYDLRVKTPISTRLSLDVLTEE